MPRHNGSGGTAYHPGRKGGSSRRKQGKVGRGRSKGGSKYSKKNGH